MGAKTSTISQDPGGNGQSSTGANEAAMQGFAALRPLGTVDLLRQRQQQAVNSQTQAARVANDSRQRARSMSSVPDMSGEQNSTLVPTTVNVGQMLGLPQLDLEDLDEESSRVVYAAQSLPSHIWSLNGGFETND